MSEHQVMQGAFKFLILADGSPEFPNAAHYAGLRARATGSGLVMLAVVEPSGGVYWSTVEQEMRREALEAAKALTDRFAAEIWADSQVQPEIVIREGEVRAELRRLVEADADIKVIVLAAGAGREGPGPLVSSLGRGQALGGRALPVIVLPAGLTRPEVEDLAGVAPPTAPGEVPAA